MVILTIAGATAIIPVVAQAACLDADDDGHYAMSAECTEGDDCDDSDATVYPYAEELCDGKWNGCPGKPVEGWCEWDGAHLLESEYLPNGGCLVDHCWTPDSSPSKKLFCYYENYNHDLPGKIVPYTFNNMEVGCSGSPDYPWSDAYFITGHQKTICDQEERAAWTGVVDENCIAEEIREDDLGCPSGEDCSTCE